ncbi:MAG: hypothetical protein ACE5EA_09430 [Nitrospirota bacterium]
MSISLSQISQISKKLNISSEELINRGLLAYLEREIRLAEEDIADIRDKYSVAARPQFERKIKNKETYSHPAWEDLITWENLEVYIKKLKKTIERIG